MRISLHWRSIVIGYARREAKAGDRPAAQPTFTAVVFWTIMETSDPIFRYTPPPLSPAAAFVIETPDSSHSLLRYAPPPFCATKGRAGRPQAVHQCEKEGAPGWWWCVWSETAVC